MADLNIIPTLNAAGRFEASAPFNNVVDITKYYTVAALRTIPEMEGLKLDLFTLVFSPVGVLETDYPTVLARAKAAGSIIVSLLDRNGVPCYVPSTYFVSFPLVDGVSYERMCIVTDCGACPPTTADALAQTMDHFKQYIQTTLGITATVKLGTIPTIGYVSKEQADAYENTRKAQITDSSNDVAKVRGLTATLALRDTYIATLEAKLGIVVVPIVPGIPGTGTPVPPN